MYCLDNIDRLNFKREVLIKLFNLYEHKGKEFYYKSHLKQKLSILERKTLEKNVIYLSRLIGVEVSENRLNLIINKDSTPKNISETYILNIKNTFLKINKKISTFELTANEYLNLSISLFNDIFETKYLNNYPLKNKSLLIKQEANTKRTEVKNLFEKYSFLTKKRMYEKTELIINLFVDLYNLEPLNDGNYLVNLVCMYILLLQENFSILKYCSFYEKIYNCKEIFEKNLSETSFNWEEGYSKTSVLTECIIDCLEECYKEIDRLCHFTDLGLKMNKYDDIMQTIFKLPETFTKEDIRKVNIYASMSTIDRVLKDLRDQDIIRANGVGRSATWVRLRSYNDFDHEKAEALFNISE